MSSYRELSDEPEQLPLLMTTYDAIKALEESEARFHDIADRIEQGLWVRGADGKHCLYLNPAFIKIWGRSLEQMNAMSWGDTVHPDDREEAYHFYLKHQTDGRDYRQSYRILRPNGEVRWIENQGYSILDERGRLLRMAGIARDVTEQRKIEEELRLSQKMKSLGKLSTGIAHEINTPCQYVSDNISFFSESMVSIADVLKEMPALLNIARKVVTDQVDLADIERIENIYHDADLEFLLEELPPAVEQTKSGMDQIKKIVLAMKGFAHPGDKKVLTNINEVIVSAILIARSEWKYVAEVNTELDENLPLVNIVSPAINQVMLNLITNAAHAIRDVTTGESVGNILIKSFIKDENVIISISDNGPGIADDILEDIFDPFFTTKEVGEGTGQGLSIVHKIINEDHGGTISVSSLGASNTDTMSTASGQSGACFTIALPLD